MLLRFPLSTGFRLAHPIGSFIPSKPIHTSFDNHRSRRYCMCGFRRTWLGERKMDQLQKPEPLAVDVPVAGEMADMNPQQSYRAAREGYMPVVHVGKGRVKVPLAKWRAILSGEAAG